MSEHAKLSPSSADRWMACPGSVVLSKDLPERTSSFAEEGTQAHALAEAVLTLRKELPSHTPEMLEHVKVYTDYIDQLWADGGESKWIEHQIKVNDQIWGTADALVWVPGTATLHVVDLKYGAGVAVEVPGNLQLKIYAAAALLTLKLKARTIVSTIVQPRLPHTEGFIRSKEFSSADLIDFYADLTDASKRVDLAAMVYNTTAAWTDEYLKPTEKGCKWCLAAPTCPKLKREAQAVAKQVFEVATPYDPKDLAKTLDFLPILEGYIKNVREFAYAEAEKGHEIPDYKLVEKRPARKWRDIEAAKAYFGNAPEFYTTPELITPAAAEKLMDKEERPKLAELTLKESSGHTLVHSSHKRPSVRLDAKHAFAVDVFS